MWTWPSAQACEVIPSRDSKEYLSDQKARSSMWTAQRPWAAVMGTQALTAGRGEGTAKISAIQGF